MNTLFFLNVGSLKDLTRIAGDSITYWKELMEHPNYDQWWQERDSRRSCYDIDPAVLIVGVYSTQKIAMEPGSYTRLFASKALKPIWKLLWDHGIMRLEW